MKVFLALALALALVTTTQLCFATTERYQQRDPMVHPNLVEMLNFLQGSWICREGHSKIIESWSRTPDGCFIGVKESGASSECDFFAVEPAGGKGCVLRMRRMGINLENTEPSRWVGNVYAPYTNKARISWSNWEPGPAKMLFLYDSPAPDILNLEIKTEINNKISEKTFHYTRVSRSN